MTSASGYPQTLDTDVQLYRRTATDAIIPADHNNLVDAIQAVQAAVGTADDNTGHGGAKTFNHSLMDHVTFPSTGGVSVRYPWMPPDASSWYARGGVTPAAWTLAAGVSVDYATVPGLAVLTKPSGIPGLVASCTLPGTQPFWATVRAFLFGISGSPHTVFHVGFSTNGLGTDLDGFNFFTPGITTQNIAELVNSAATVPGVTVGFNQVGGAVLLGHTNTVVKHYVTPGSGLWFPASADHAAARTPTKFCIYCVSDSAPSDRIVLDYIAFGNTTPAGLF